MSDTKLRRPTSNMDIEQPSDKPNLYKHGLPFSEVLAWNLDDLDKRVKGKKASLIILDGGVGEGKTTLIVEVLDYFCKINNLPEITIEDEKGNAGPQIAMGGKDFLKKLAICHENKLVCVGYDEAGDFSKRGSLTNFNAMLNRTFDTFRGYKIIVVIGLPNFNVLDNNLFDNQIPRMLLHLSGRTDKQGNFDAYGLDEMNWIRYWMGKWPKHKTKAYTKVIPNFRGHFRDIAPSRSRELDRVSTKNKLKILKKSAVKIEGWLSYAEISQKVDRSIIWVKKAVSNLNIKHKSVVDRAKYFDPHVVNQLAELIENTDDPGRKTGTRNKEV